MQEIDSSVPREIKFCQIRPTPKKNIYAGIIGYQGPKVDYEGLLGMNFLENIEYHIGFTNQTLEWK